MSLNERLPLQEIAEGLEEANDDLENTLVHNMAIWQLPNQVRSLEKDVEDLQADVYQYKTDNECMERRIENLRLDIQDQAIAGSRGATKEELKEVMGVLEDHKKAIEMCQVNLFNEIVPDIHNLTDACAMIMEFIATLPMEQQHTLMQSKVEKDIKSRLKYTHFDLIPDIQAMYQVDEQTKERKDADMYMIQCRDSRYHGENLFCTVRFLCPKGEHPAESQKCLNNWHCNHPPCKAYANACIHVNGALYHHFMERLPEDAAWNTPTMEELAETYRLTLKPLPKQETDEKKEETSVADLD